MKVQPTPEQWALLNPIEKVNFRIADYVNREEPARDIAARVGSTLGKAWVELAASNMCLEYGFEHWKELDPTRGVLLVANHRSLFDLYAVTARLFTLYGPHHRIYFPVRSTFFYDHPLGQLINVPVACGSMYPPIMRDKQRKEWNRFSTSLLVELLQDPKNMVGFHPEGTRSRTPDPYQLLPGKPGGGELIYRARPNVVPVFLQGFPRFAWHSPLMNVGLLDQGRVWVHMVMGRPLNFEEELAMPESLETYQCIVNKVMEAIRVLSEQERVVRRQWLLGQDGRRSG